MAGMGWVDITLLAILAISVIVGLMRGLTFEVLSLLGWVVGYFAALWFAPSLAPHIPVGAPGSAVQHGAAFAITFVVAMIVWGLGVRLVSMLIKSSPLSGFDRLLGAGFGLLRGLVLLLVLVTLVSYTPWSRSPDWRASSGVVWLNAVLGEIVPLLPSEIAPHLPSAARSSDI